MNDQPTIKDVRPEVCPKHGCEYVMKTYGDPDAGKVCPKCEDEAREGRQGGK